MTRHLVPTLATALALAASATCEAEEPPAPSPPITHGNGKLLLTGGVSSIDGAAGGGLTPWAVTASYATQNQFGGIAHATRVVTNDYTMNAYGAALGIDDRFELSIDQRLHASGRSALDDARRSRASTGRATKRPDERKHESPSPSPLRCRLVGLANGRASSHTSQ